MWSPWRKAGEQAQPRELRHCQSPALGPQDGPAETHQHHPAGPQKPLLEMPQGDQTL